MDLLCKIKVVFVKMLLKHIHDIQRAMSPNNLFLLWCSVISRSMEADVLNFGRSIFVSTTAICCNLIGKGSPLRGSSGR